MQSRCTTLNSVGHLNRLSTVHAGKGVIEALVGQK